MIKLIITVAISVLVGYLIRHIIPVLKKKMTLKEAIKDVTSDVKTVTDKVTPAIEKFYWKKFWNGLLNITSGVQWSKALTGILNIRTIIIVVTLVFGGYTGWIYMKGRSSQPIQTNIAYEETLNVLLPKGTIAIVKDKNSSIIYGVDKKGKKTAIKGNNLPSVQKALKPFASIITDKYYNTYAVGGYGMGLSGNGWEGGLGVDVARFYSVRLGVFATSYPAVYVGVGYMITDNFGLQGGYGVGKSGDNRYFVGGRFDF